MKKFLAILLCALMVSSLVACGKKEETNANGEENPLEGAVELVLVQGEDTFTYEANEDGKYDIVGFASSNNQAHPIVIPEMIDNIAVTGIADEAFKACNQLGEVTIPASVKRIGDYAFYGCQYLTKVTMADSVTEIGAGAFQACVALAEITLSAELTEISASMFADCAVLTTVAIPAKVTAIGAFAFARCVALTEIVLPEAVKSIGDVAFNGCSALAKATVPNGVETLGKDIFSKCASDFALQGEIDPASNLYLYARTMGYPMAFEQANVTPAA